MITTKFAGHLIPQDGSTDARALELLNLVVNGYGLTGQPTTADSQEIDGAVEIRLTDSSVHGLFMPISPAGEARRQVYVILAQRLQVSANNLDDIALAGELDMALVRKHRALVQYVQTELSVTIPRRTQSQIPA